MAEIPWLSGAQRRPAHQPGSDPVTSGRNPRTGGSGGRWCWRATILRPLPSPGAVADRCKYYRIEAQGKSACHQPPWTGPALLPTPLVRECPYRPVQPGCHPVPHCDHLHRDVLARALRTRPVCSEPTFGSGAGGVQSGAASHECPDSTDRLPILSRPTYVPAQVAHADNPGGHGPFRAGQPWARFRDTDDRFCPPLRQRHRPFPSAREDHPAGSRLVAGGGR